MPPSGDVVADDEAIWVPITINLPLGLTKAFTPDNCAPLSLLIGPFSIIMLAQTANTVLVPVLPFLVKDVGATAVAYGMLQSTLWTSQTVLSPVLGWLSDRIGRRPVILLSCLVSAGGNALLAVAHTVPMMMAARVVSGLGFQIALFRAYFADSAPKKEKAGKFGLIGVIQSFSLFAGPSIGGVVARLYGRRTATFLSASLFLAAAFIAFLWKPDEQRADQVRAWHARACTPCTYTHGRPTSSAPTRRARARAARTGPTRAQCVPCPPRPVRSVHRSRCIQCTAPSAISAPLRSLHGGMRCAAGACQGDAGGRVAQDGGRRVARQDRPLAAEGVRPPLGRRRTFHHLPSAFHRPP